MLMVQCVECSIQNETRVFGLYGAIVVETKQIVVMGDLISGYNNGLFDYNPGNTFGAGGRCQ